MSKYTDIKEIEFENELVLYVFIQEELRQDERATGIICDDAGTVILVKYDKN